MFQACCKLRKNHYRYQSLQAILRFLVGCPPVVVPVAVDDEETSTTFSFVCAVDLLKWLWSDSWSRKSSAGKVMVSDLTVVDLL